MARAHSIWIVRDTNDGYQRPPIGAFTVKHELISWLKKIDPYGLTITVVRDGNLKYTNYPDDLLSEWEVMPMTVDASLFLQQAVGGD